MMGDLKIQFDAILKHYAEALDREAERRKNREELSTMFRRAAEIYAEKLDTEVVLTSNYAMVAISENETAVFWSSGAAIYEKNIKVLAEFHGACGEAQMEVFEESRLVPVTHPGHPSHGVRQVLKEFDE